MPSDAWPTTNPKPPQKSLESLKETFKQKLDAILNKQITLENIETFADEALEDTLKLTKDITEEYEHNPTLNAGPASVREKEDFVFSALELPNLQEVLQSIIDVKERIDSIKKDISETNVVADKVLIPPQHDLPIELHNGKGGGIEEKKFVPRLLTLLYILETDFKITKKQIQITEGRVTHDMVRKTPYVRVEISDIKRIIYICDEEGNASYVFDTEKLEEAGIQTEVLDVLDKSVINDLIAKHPGIGVRIIQTKNWRTHISKLLENEIPENSTTPESTRRPVSEFKKREKKTFLPFDEFKKEVKDWYDGLNDKKGSIKELYTKERRKNHPNWPSIPEVIYLDKGWESWPSLVEKFLSFDKFKKEVKDWYDGLNDKKGGIRRLYNLERKNHPNWSSIPEVIYLDQGWKGWSEIVGIERDRNKEFLPFDEFKKEVKDWYDRVKKDKRGGIRRLYNLERKNHPNWPANPDRIYRNKGWKSKSTLVGKEK